MEQVELGEAKTPFLKFGDRVRIEMRDEKGASVFGAIDHVVEKTCVTRCKDRGQTPNHHRFVLSSTTWLG